MPLPVPRWMTAMAAAALVALPLACVADAADPPTWVGAGPGSAVGASAPCTAARAVCRGTIEIPLDRSAPDTGTVPVAFTLTPPTGPEQRGAVAVLAGGPGFANDPDGWETIVGPLRADHAVLAIDYPGTGGSGHLFCPGLAVVGDRQPPDAVAACADQLGDRAQLYGTATIADALEAVRTALRLPRLDVVGSSFGTYAAQAYAVRHPGAVRSVVLDGTLPLGTSLLDLDVRVHDWIAEVREQVCDDRASTCREVDDPAAEWDAAVENARRRGETAALLALEQKLFVEGRTAELVATVAAANRGDRAALDELLAEDPERIFRELPEPTFPTAADTITSAAQYFAVFCSDLASPLPSGGERDVRGQALERALAALRPDTFAPFTVSEHRTATGEVGFLDARNCVHWTAPTDRPDLELPAEGPYPHVPVLAIDGELDLATPPSGGREAAARFPRGQQIVIPGKGHAVAATEPCAGAAVAAFIATGEIDAQPCINQAVNADGET